MGVALVVATSVMLARRAARQVRLDLEPLPAILSVRQALAEGSQVLPPVTVRRGQPEATIASAAHRLSGSLEVGGQEHFYLEGQVAYAIPQEQGQWLVHSSTQHPGEVQHWIAHALGLESHRITVQCRRMGGGFGGKETQAGHMAVWACLAARKFSRPVKLRLDRDDDFIITGKRHPFEYDYTVGFDAGGLITGLQLMMAANCGFSADLSGPVADRAIFHADNAYFLSDVEIVSHRCKTHLQSQTAFRGFGGPQGMIVIEAIIENVEIKKKTYAQIEAVVGTHCVIASNTSSLCITELGAGTTRPDKVAGLHFFNPVPLMKLVEVIRALATSQETYDALMTYARAIGKEPVTAPDRGGFIVNRLLVPYLLDAIRCLEEGLGTVEDIDNGMKLGCGYPMGPFTLLDYVGLDTTYYIANIMFEEFRETRFAPPPLLKRMVLAGHCGKKAGKGFYDYSK